MQRISCGVAIALGLALIIGMGSPAGGGMMEHGRMGQSETAAEPPPGGGMGMMGQSGMPHRGQEAHISHRNRVIRMLTAELDLSAEQTKQIKDLLLEVMKANIKGHAELQIAELELQQLLEAEPVDLAQVEAKLKGSEGLRTTLRLNLIKAHEQAKALLTPEQRQKFAPLHDHFAGLMGSSLMGMLDMPAEAASGPRGGMEMKKPQTMRRMMGAGRSGQRQPPTPLAASQPNLTVEDTQGAVSVKATLLTPEKPRADGKLAVRVTLETHSVDLDPYRLETLALLREPQGREVQAVGLESASGSGHHREGVLIFPSLDASGKPLLSPEATTLTLLLRGLAGVQERSLRWQLPASAHP
jgi:Spy/CpxP family protein refolding chaperone